jgi:hypothetical protein
MNIKPKVLKWTCCDGKGTAVGSINGIRIFSIFPIRNNGGYEILSPFLVPHQLVHSGKPTKLIEAKKHCQGRLMNEIFHLLFEKDLG